MRAPFTRLARLINHKRFRCSFWKSSRGVAFCPNNNVVHIYKFFTHKWEKLHVLSKHDQIASGIDWSRSSNKIVTVSHDRNSYVWTQEGHDWVPTLIILKLNRAALCVQWSLKGGLARLLGRSMNLLSPVSRGIQTMGSQASNSTDWKFGEEMVADNLTIMMHDVKVLILKSSGPNLDAVIDFLKCFPCVKELYIMSSLQMDMKNVSRHNPLGPIECLDLHLSEVVLKGYKGKRPDVNFAKFFVLNTKVLEVMKFGVLNSRTEKWRANQHMRLQLDSRASRNARFDFRTDNRCYNFACGSLPMFCPWLIPSVALLVDVVDKVDQVDPFV